MGTSHGLVGNNYKESFLNRNPSLLQRVKPTTMHLYSYSACTRTYEPLWQQWLGRCVRLYLALDEPGSEALPLELALRLLEHRLRKYLQTGYPVTPDTTAEAWALLEAAQVEWLGDATRCAQLRRELSVAQALRPTPFPTSRWLGAGAKGAWGFL